jgi:hypothetical protein
MKPTPSDLAAYTALLYSIAADAVANSAQPIGEVHRKTKLTVKAMLNNQADAWLELHV